ADLMPADLPALWPALQPLASAPIPAAVRGVRLPIRASIDGEIGLDGTLSPLNVEVQATTGVVDLPRYLAEPLDIAAAELEGTVSDDFGSFEINQARIVSRGAELSGAGGIIWREDEPSFGLELVANGVRAEDLPAFWPPLLGTDVRDWVLENIETGLVSEAAVELDLRPGDWGPEPLRDDAVAGSFAFEDLSVRYVDEMPPLQNAAGTAVFDADRMEFDVVGGDNAGLKLKGGNVTITGMGKPGRLATQLRVRADAEGSIEQALTVLDHPPLKIASELAIAPSKTGGRVVTNVHVRIPLHDEVTEDEAVVLAEAELIDLAIEQLPKLGGGVRMDRGAFKLVVDEEAVRLGGTAEVNGIPLAIDVFEPLEDETSKRRIDLAGRLGRQELERQGIAIAGLDGEVGFKATVTETSRRFWIDLEADLAALAIAPPGLAWRKPIGQAGVLRASIAMPIEGPIDVKQFDLETDDLRASGTLELSPSNDGLKTLALDVLRLADTDVAIRASSDGQGGHDVVIEGKRLDLDALFGDDQEIGDDFERFHVILRTDQLLARGIELVDVEADAVHGPDGWRSASVIGALRSGGRLALELTPDGDDRQLELRSDNAGALITAFDLGQQVEGGAMLLSARFKSQDPVVAEGRFEIESFVLKDAPLLARLLTLASLTGIGNLLGGEGVQMDHLILPFALDEQKLYFTDGLMRGSQLGLTLKGDVGLEEEMLDLAGTIIPVYSLNRLIGQVPIIGRILTGVDGRGAFAATYSIKGPRGNPTVYVNPLSILTPGLIRDFFGGLINGTLKPPDIRETDD
ncbi:MAG: AsmA-like C-terminal domain-containing protein, partial [Geminicoccaceae bacterium]